MAIFANDTVGVVLRLIDLGVEPFLVSSALIGVVAQRMVRRICPNCASPIEVSSTEAIAYKTEMDEDKTTFMYGSGCKNCSNTGYRGRTGLFEILNISEDIRTMPLKGATAVDIRKQAINEGMVPLARDGMIKVQQETTTPSEVIRNAYAE